MTDGRVGLVLGAGGVLGLAYHAGVLAALADVTGWDPRTADVVVGTSAGSITVSLLRAGLSAGDLAARATGEPLSPEGRVLVARAGAQAGPAAWPGRPASPGAGSTALLRQALRHPGSVRLGPALAAALPHGTVPTETFIGGLRGLLGRAWPDRPTWICAVRLDDGARVVFGAPGAPRPDWPEAVAASCAIPSFFQPVEIGGRRYVDGGTHSVTNLDALAGEGLDLVVVSAPMSMSGARGLPTLDVPWRLAGAARLASELAAVRRRGTAVVVLAPTAADRRAMGVNLMDARRREGVARQARTSALVRLRQPDARGRLAPLVRG
ncbi:MAG TPA: patatin-like phospholipase family protein [Candidatus Eisenbacteria bacterium]|nr:patatin-like phospholipase family protein [Candidatus Eisenbacteria bacterium]